MKSKEINEQELLTSRSTALAVTVAFYLIALCWIMKTDVAAFQAMTLFSALGCLIAWVHYFSLKTKVDIASMLDDR